MGSYGYLVKPISPNEALINVASALRRRELERARLEHLTPAERSVAELAAAGRTNREIGRCSYAGSNVSFGPFFVTFEIVADPASGQAALYWNLSLTVQRR
jgi:DNA-binding response OmpR family regulator